MPAEPMMRIFRTFFLISTRTSFGILSRIRLRLISAFVFIPFLVAFLFYSAERFGSEDVVQNFATVVVFIGTGSSAICVITLFFENRSKYYKIWLQLQEVEAEFEEIELPHSHDWILSVFIVQQLLILGQITAAGFLSGAVRCLGRCLDLLNGALATMASSAVPEILQALRRLRARHHRLLCLRTALQCSFQVLITFTVGTTFLTWTYAAVSNSSIEHSWYSCYRSSYWVIFFFFKLITILATCTETSSKADKTAKCLHELFIENDDASIREEVEIFSLQLLHRKIEFSACGFFKLDFSLLYSMVGAVTTYIVVLIQFQTAQQQACSTTHNLTNWTTPSSDLTQLP